MAHGLIQIEAAYDFESGFPSMDSVIEQAVGRKPDYSGAGFGLRDLGWACATDWEARNVERALRRIGVTSRRIEAALS